MLRLAVCSSFGPGWLIPRLASFYATHPGVDLQLRLYAQDPEQTADVADAFITAREVKPGFAAVHVLDEMLVADDSAKGGLQWSSIGYGKSDREDLTRELRRIRAEPEVREEMRKRMHHGMTVVTTQTASRAEYRTNKDFVVIDGIY